MELTKKGILDNTHYGLNIFSYILRKYYPNQTVLACYGKRCKLTRNPFNGDSESLRISVIDCIAVFEDAEQGTSGDVFDFAARYFNCSDQRLLTAISDALKLNHSTDTCEGLSTSIKYPQVPLFSTFRKPISNVVPWQSMSLYDVYCLIKSNTFKKQTDKLRSIEDKKEARKYKATNFYYATFSGVFERRTDSCLIQHSGLLTIDLDHLDDVNLVKKRCLKDKELETQLLFVSPSGTGLKWIVSIDAWKYTHKEYFEAISNYITYRYGISADPSGSDVSRACFLSHDPNVIINPTI